LGGSIQPNAAPRLTWALTSLKGVDERILIPGFYDDVIPPSARDRELMDKLPDFADEYKKRYGASGFIKGLTGGTNLKVEEVFTPTCTICGLTSRRYLDTKAHAPNENIRIDLYLKQAKHMARALKEFSA